MLSWILQITIISIILIFLIHHLIHFFKSTLTIPKIKDLVNTSNQKYENIYNIIQNNSKKNLQEPNQEFLSNKEYTSIDLLPQPLSDDKNDNFIKPNMKNELKNFIKKQLKINENNNVINFENSYLHR